MPLPEPLRIGYRTFREENYQQERARYLKNAKEGQKPHSLVIACCDSRAAPETIFNAAAGEVFVVRNVANLVPAYAPDGRQHATSAALEFAVTVLEVPNIVVMGHGRCGGIAAAVNQGASIPEKTDFIGQWVSQLREIVTKSPQEEGCCHEHYHQKIERISVEQSLVRLRSYPFIKQREDAGTLTLYGTWFDIALGELFTFNSHTKDWEQEAHL